MVSRSKTSVRLRAFGLCVAVLLLSVAGLAQIGSDSASRVSIATWPAELLSVSPAYAGSKSLRERRRARMQAMRQRRKAQRGARRAARQAQRQARAQSKRQARQVRRAERRQAKNVRRQARKTQKANRAQARATRRNPERAAEKAGANQQTAQRGDAAESPKSRGQKRKQRRRDKAAARRAEAAEIAAAAEFSAPVDEAKLTFDPEFPPDTAVTFVKQLGNTLSNLMATKPAPAPAAKTMPTGVRALGAPAATPPQPVAVTPAAALPAPATAAPAAPALRAAPTRPRRQQHIPSVAKSHILPKFAPRRTSPTELIATNISPTTLAAATEIGIKAVTTGGGFAGGGTLTKLILPQGMQPQKALASLAGKSARDVISYNYHYQQFQPSKRHGTQPRAGNYGSGANAGADLIGWSHKLSRCAEGMTIGVIDTGIDAAHNAFSGIDIRDADVTGATRAPAPDAHATGVLSILAGGPGGRVQGLVPGAHFYVADVFFMKDGVATTDTYSLLNALTLMKEFGVQVLNLSLSGPEDPLIRKAIKALTDSGTIVVAAAGNGGPGAPKSYPAAYNDVLAVTAVGANLRSFIYANHGSYIDIAAPGVDVWTAMPGQKYGHQTGTSFAVPYVTAAVAAIYRGLPSKTKAAFLERVSVRDLGAPNKDKIYGRGLLLAPQTCEPPAGSWTVSVKQETPAKGHVRTARKP